MTDTDFKEVINSIVYNVLLSVGYEQRTKEENEEFYFEVWAEDVELQDVLCSVVDSYVCTRLKTMLSYILASEQNIGNVDPGLYGGNGGSWEDMTKTLAYELLRMTAYKEVQLIVDNNLLMLVGGGVAPESNNQQLWFGEEASPVFCCLKKLKESTGFSIVHHSKRYLKIRASSTFFGMTYIVFEGRCFTGDPQDLVELTLGGPLCVKVRRIYLPEKDLKVGNMLKKLIQGKYIEVANYGSTESEELLLSYLR